MKNCKVILLMVLAAVLGGQGVGAQVRTEFQKAWPLWEREDTVEVVIIGDVMMHARQLEYDHRTFLEGIRGRLEGATMAVANMEFPLAGEPYSGYPRFAAPDAYAEYVRDCGVDVFLTANNHILDQGEMAALRTMDIYDNMEGVQYTGISQNDGNYPLVMALKGIRIALINFTYGTNLPSEEGFPKVNRMNREEVSKAIERAKMSKADFIVALPHWGEEYVLQHSREQEKWAVWLAESGVDAIVGAHPHVVQDSTVISTWDGRKVPVFYSIGNAVSNMSATNTRLELAVTLRFAHRRWDSPVMLPPKVEFLWCTLPGMLTDSYMTIPVREYEGRRGQWITPSDYDNMIRTLERVSASTGIKD